MYDASLLLSAPKDLGPELLGINNLCRVIYEAIQEGATIEDVWLLVASLEQGLLYGGGVWHFHG